MSPRRSLSVARLAAVAGSVTAASVAFSVLGLALMLAGVLDEAPESFRLKRW